MLPANEIADDNAKFKARIFGVAFKAYGHLSLRRDGASNANWRKYAIPTETNLY